MKKMGLIFCCMFLITANLQAGDVSDAARHKNDTKKDGTRISYSESKEYNRIKREGGDLQAFLVQQKERQAQLQAAYLQHSKKAKDREIRLA